MSGAALLPQVWKVLRLRGRDAFLLGDGGKAPGRGVWADPREMAGFGHMEIS